MEDKREHVSHRYRCLRGLDRLGEELPRPLYPWMGALAQIDHSRPMSPDVSAVRARRRVSQPGGHVTPRVWARRVSIFRLSAPGSRSNTAYHPVSTLGTDCKRMARTDGNRRPIPPGSL